METAVLRWQRRLLRGLLILILAYPLYLLLLGPYSAFSGTGRLDFVPQAIRDACYLPAAPLYLVPGLRSADDGYLHRWYRDPNEADPETRASRSCWLPHAARRVGGTRPTSETPSL